MSSKQGMTVTRRAQLKGVLDRVIEAMAQKFLPEARKALEKMPAYAAFDKAAHLVADFNNETERMLQARYKERRRKLESLGFVVDSTDSDAMKLRSNPEVHLNNVLNTYRDCSSVLSSEAQVVGGTLQWNIGTSRWPKSDPLLSVPIFPPDIQARITSIMDRFTLALSEHEAVILIAEMGSVMEETNAQKPSKARGKNSRSRAAKTGKKERPVGA
jgi:hypothetical protein